MSKQILSKKMLEAHLKAFPKCEWLCPHNIEVAEPTTEQYLCQSYYDDENVLRDCTCGKCR